MSGTIHIRELAGWDLDNYEFRPSPTHEKRTKAKHLIAQRTPFEQSNPIIATPKGELSEMLAHHSKRPDLLSEMSGLSWSLGVVDLRSLIAFQRRLAFRPKNPQLAVPAPGNWPALIDLSFATSEPLQCDVIHDRSTKTLTVRSTNPNLHIRTTGDVSTPLSIQTGSPFFEVASLRNRWFLRDGYHRAYTLLRAGVFEVPAVIVRTSNLQELGAVQPWFFPEEVLFSKTPPRVVDFLNEDLVFEYERPILIKTLRIKMEETLTPRNTEGAPE